VNVGALEVALAAEKPLFALNSVGAYVEQHIEQESSLLRNDKSLGIVTAIRGNMRTPENIHFYGQPDHSGACPMDQRYDAGRALIHTAYQFDMEMAQKHQAGNDIVWTIPELGTPHASSTTVCKHAYGKFEVRSTEVETLEASKEALIQIARVKAHDMKARLVLNPDDITISPPAIMDERVQQLIERMTIDLGVSYQHMPSGAGHDAGILAKAGVPTTVLFSRHAGRSHLKEELLGRTPEENPYTLDSDYANAIKVLAYAAQQSVARFQPARSNQSFAERLLVA
jgi:N-carbamoyl-L-amino-acid hydrolase